MGKFQDLMNMKFHRLTVVKKSRDLKTNRIIWGCKCDCENPEYVWVDTYRLKSGHTTSCGCYHNEVIGNINRKYKDDYRSRLHVIWMNIKLRCSNNKGNKNAYYDEKGISICDEWKYDYLTFKRWALNNGYKDGLTIDRRDNNLGYYPDNCRWVDDTIQAINRGDFKNNTSGYKGVSWDNKNKKWKAQIAINKKDIYLGEFININEAIKARKEAEEKYHKPLLENISHQP